MSRPERQAQGRWAALAVVGAIVLGVLYPVLLVESAHRSNGVSSLPVDDAWIHLTYARNLHDYGTFSYVTEGPRSAGSTAPLYTLLLALGFSLTRDEKTLAYGLGVLFQLLFLAALAGWAHRRLGRPLWAAAATLIVALDPRIGILAVSGMETSCFLFLTALVFWAWSARRATAAGTALGLALWIRPEALVLAGVLAIDAALRATAGRDAPAAPRPRALLARAGAPLAALGAAYALFNLWAGGGPLPSTYAAKTAFYAANSRIGFVFGDLGQLLGRGAWPVIGVCALVAAGRELQALCRSRRGVLRAELGWAAALPLAYFVLLPFSHVFGRYLAPALPALAVAGLGGLEALVGAVSWSARSRRALVAAALLAGGALQLHAARGGFDAYRDWSRYYYTRHERTGRWLAAHTPSNAVVATHDVGAIGFYSGRKIVDLAGVVQPEVIPHLHRSDYVDYLESLFAREGVTHLALLDSWIDAANVAPLFLADPQPELLRVYPWRPGRTRLIAADIARLNAAAVAAMRSNDPVRAVALLRESTSRDPRVAPSWELLGAALERLGAADQAQAACRRALELFPEALGARLRLATLLAERGAREEARREVLLLLDNAPRHPEAQRLLQQLAPARAGPSRSLE